MLDDTADGLVHLSAFLRPSGLPDWPFLNCVYFGGLPSPTLGLARLGSSSLMISPSRGVSGARRRCGQLVERLAVLGMDRCLAGQCLPAADGGIDVVWIKLDGAA